MACSDFDEFLDRCDWQLYFGSFGVLLYFLIFNFQTFVSRVSQSDVFKLTLKNLQLKIEKQKSVQLRILIICGYFIKLNAKASNSFLRQTVCFFCDMIITSLFNKCNSTSK